MQSSEKKSQLVSALPIRLLVHISQPWSATMSIFCGHMISCVSRLLRLQFDMTNYHHEPDATVIWHPYMCCSHSAPFCSDIHNMPLVPLDVSPTTGVAISDCGIRRPRCGSLQLPVCKSRLPPPTTRYAPPLQPRRRP